MTYLQLEDFDLINDLTKSMDEKELERRTISIEDLVTIIYHIVLLNNTPNAKADDIDHLGLKTSSICW